MCFPTLFSIAQEKGITNADYLSWRDSSVVRVVTFMELLYPIRMKRHVEDKLYKRPTKSSLFEVKSFYRVLTDGGIRFSLEEYMEHQNSTQDCLFYLDCCYG